MQLKKQFDEEVVMLSQSLQQFRMASNKYEDQKLILKSLAEPSNQGQEILIPLTQCLFINGSINIYHISKIIYSFQFIFNYNIFS